MATKRAAKKTGEETPEREAGHLPLHLFFGADDYERDLALKAFVNQLCPPAEQAMALETFAPSGPKIDEAIPAIRKTAEALMAPSFFSANRVVWLQDADFLGANPTGKSEVVKNELQAFGALLQKGLPPGVTLVLSSNVADKRTTFFKLLEKLGTIHEYALPDKDYKLDQAMRPRVEALFEKAGLRISDDMLSAFLDRAGYEMRHLVQEVEKLRLHVGTQRGVTFEDIELMVAPARESQMWDFAEAFGDGDFTKALRVLSQSLYQGLPAVALVMNLEARLRDLMVLRECLDNGALRLGGAAPWWKANWQPDAENEERLARLIPDPRTMNPFRVGKLAAQARRFKAARLRSWFDAVLAAHESMVSEQVPAEVTLEMLAIRLLGPVHAYNASR